MRRVRNMLWTLSLATCLGIGMAGLLHPGPAQAGDLHLSIGFGLPVPGAVVPAPVVVAPPPVMVQPAPVLAYPPPVVVVEPYRVWPYHLPPGLGKKSSGYHPGHGYPFGKRHKHDDDD